MREDTAKEHTVVCLACGEPRPTPSRKDITKDHYGRPLTFCNRECLARYMLKQPRA